MTSVSRSYGVNCCLQNTRTQRLKTDSQLRSLHFRLERLAACGSGAGGLLRAMLHFQHDPYEIDGIFGAELLHDVLAMHLDRSSAYSEISGGFLIRGGGRYPTQHLDFPAGELVTTWKVLPFDFGSLVLLLAACPSGDPPVHTLDDRARVGLLFDEIIRAVFDRLDGARIIAAAGYDENRRRVFCGVELFQSVQPGWPGHANVEDYAGRYPDPSGDNKRRRLFKGRHLIA